MEVTKKLQKLSLAALIVSLLPLATLVPVFLKITLPDGVRMIWAICNIAFALTGLLLSVICVKSEESRSIVNIMSTLVSVALVLMMLGIVALLLGFSMFSYGTAPFVRVFFRPAARNFSRQVKFSYASRRMAKKWCTAPRWGRAQSITPQGGQRPAAGRAGNVQTCPAGGRHPSSNRHPPPARTGSGYFRCHHRRPLFFTRSRASRASWQPPSAACW